MMMRAGCDMGTSPRAVPQGSTRYQPAIPPSWWEKTWQWYSQRPGLSSMKRAVIVSLGPTAGVSTKLPAGVLPAVPVDVEVVEVVVHPDHVDGDVLADLARCSVGVLPA